MRTRSSGLSPNPTGSRGFRPGPCPVNERQTDMSPGRWQTSPPAPEPYSDTREPAGKTVEATMGRKWYLAAWEEPTMVSMSHMNG